MDELTIVIVSYQSGEFIRQNIELINGINSSRIAKIIIVDNAHESLDAKIDLPNTIVISGAHRCDGETASDHHHAGIQLGINHVESKYLLILDPDFYIIRKEWIQDILSFMQSQNIAILGAPWHPQHFVKWRYFPCSHCLFIDTEKIPICEVDLSPGFTQEFPLQAKLVQRSIITRGYQGVLRRIFRKRAASIGHSRDTGYALFMRYSCSTKIQMAMFQPVWRKVGLKKLCEYLLPDFLSYVPKRRNYYTNQGMEKFGLPDCQQYAWEEFLWEDQPWGFHIRCYPKKSLRKENVKIKYAQETLKPWLDDLLHINTKGFTKPIS